MVHERWDRDKRTRKCARFPLRYFFWVHMSDGGSPYFERKLTQFWLGFPKQNAISNFFLTFFVIKLRLLFFRAKFVCQSESSNRKLSSKCLLFRVNGKGWKFWMPTRKSKENFKNQKGSSIWGEDLVLILVLSLERRSTGPWVSLRLGWSLFLPGTVPRDWYKNSLGSFRFENPVQNTLRPNFGCIKN